MMNHLRDDAGESAFPDVHRELLRSRPAMRPVSAGFRARVMDHLYELEAAPAAAATRFDWRRSGAIAAAAAVLIGAGVYFVGRSMPRPAPGGLVAFGLPVDPGPVIRLVTDRVDQPLLDQAQKMMNDTRRATRAVVQCIPFASRETLR